VPEGLKLVPLGDSDVDHVNSVWKYAGPTTKLFLQHALHYHPSIAMVTDDGRRVGHILGQGEGIMGTLHVEPEFRRRGYGKILTTHLAQRYFDMGKEVFAYVDKDNDMSLTLHLSAGFKVVPGVEVTWIQHVPNKIAVAESSEDTDVSSTVGK
jgi:ribosomal protein S18 acetylase RimI-like enzyme